MLPACEKPFKRQELPLVQAGTGLLAVSTLLLP